MEYSLLTSKWHWPSLGTTMPAILLSIPKCESASLTNTNNRIELFLHPILSCGVRRTHTLITALSGTQAQLRSRPSPRKQPPAWWRQSHTRAGRCSQTRAASRLSGWMCQRRSSATARVYSRTSADRWGLGRCYWKRKKNKHKGQEMILTRVTAAVVVLHTCRGSPALLLWSWWTAGWVSPQTTRSPCEIDWWGWPFLWREWSPSPWSSADRQPWRQTSPSGSRGPRGSALCAEPSPGKSPDCLHENQNRHLIRTWKQVIKPRWNPRRARVPGRNFRAIFWGEIWVLFSDSVSFPNGRFWRTWASETGNSR